MPTFNPHDTAGIATLIGQFMRQKTGGPVKIGPLKRYTVGFSWITFGFRASWHHQGAPETRDLILRVGPPDGLFAPYHASVEFLALKSLAPVDIPTPAPHWYQDDPGLLGAPFYICDQAPGEAPVPWQVQFQPGERDKLASQFVGGLAALHNFNWQNAPVAKIGTAPSITTTAGQEVDFWDNLVRTWSPGKSPILTWAARWFRQNAPTAQRISLVHGDYRIGNFLTQDQTITAVLDWELVHFGDPLEDLGWVCMRAWRGKSDLMCHLLQRDDLVTRYQALTGLAVDEKTLNYWEAFGAYKLAVIHLGAAHCFEMRGFNDLRMAGMGAQTARVLVEMEKVMERAA